MSAWDVATRKRYDLTLADHDYPPWEGRPTRTILICSEPRSGSTLLGEAMYFAGNLGCPLEYFHSGFRPDFVARWGAPDAVSYLRETQRHRTAPNGTFSAKLFWADVVALLAERDRSLADEIRGVAPADAPPTLYRAVAATLAPVFDDATFLYLRRIDQVRGAVSAEIATQTGLWRAITGVGEHLPLAEPVFDFDRIADRIAVTARAHVHWANLFAAIDARPIALTYEALTRDYHAAVTKVLTALGEPATVGTPRMQRQSDRRSETFTLRYLHETQRRLDARSLG